MLIVGPQSSDAYRSELDLIILNESDEIRASIHWSGMVTGALKWSILSQAQAMILPSHQENFGIVVAESLALGVPVLISKQVNIWREIHGYGAGFCENDDLKGCLKLLEAWSKCGDKESLSANARRCFNDHFEIHQSAINLKSIPNRKDK